MDLNLLIAFRLFSIANFTRFFISIDELYLPLYPFDSYLPRSVA